MSFEQYEVSTEKAQPIELYIFTYNNQLYEYTSSQYTQNYMIDNNSFSFNPEYIKRGDSLKLGDSGGTIETCTIEVLRTNSIALLYQGAPPELDTVRVQVFRVHGENNTEFVKIIDGTVSQVKFNGSVAELTITIEHLLNRQIPRGTLSYYCQNCIYDDRCSLIKEDFAKTCYVDIGWKGLTIFSSNLTEATSGYYTDGYLQMGNCFRAVTIHEGNHVTIKYPINQSDKQASFTIYPGCNGIFEICHSRFGNTDNFSGVPYLEKYDIYRHPYTNNQAYWIRSDVIERDTNGRVY